MNREARRKCKNTYEMAAKIENNANKKYQMYYENKYKEDLLHSIDIYIIAIMYTLHFNEKTNFGAARMRDFMEDLMSTIDNFTDGSYSPEEYKEILRKDGIEIVSSKRERK